MVLANRADPDEMLHYIGKKNSKYFSRIFFPFFKDSISIKLCIKLEMCPGDIMILYMNVTKFNKTLI